MTNFKITDEVFSILKSEGHNVDLAESMRLYQRCIDFSSNIKVKLNGPQMNTIAIILWAMGEPKLLQHIHELNQNMIGHFKANLRSIFSKVSNRNPSYDFIMPMVDEHFSDVELERLNKYKMTNLTEWLHESVKGKTLEIVKITDLKKTVLGLKDTESQEVFIVGNMHDLTFVLNGNEEF